MDYSIYYYISNAFSFLINKINNMFVHIDENGNKKIIWFDGKILDD